MLINSLPEFDIEDRQPVDAAVIVQGGGDVFEIGPEQRNVHHLVALEHSTFIDFTFPSNGPILYERITSYPIAFALTPG